MNIGEMVLIAETLGLEPDFSYERKVEKPHIQTDRLGYLPKSAKTAIIQGGELPQRFQIMEKDSGKCVYEGEVRRNEETASGIFTGYCIFTELEEEGSYYIKCDKIGCSYYFVIGRDAYLEKELELGSMIEEMRSEGAQKAQQDGEAVSRTEDICGTVSCLLAAYEMYPGLLLEIWGDGKPESDAPEAGGEDFFRMLRKETDWLLSLQDEVTGGIYENADAAFGEADGAQKAEQEISEEATAAFAGTMAKYSYLYQQYDLDYANTCLKAAAKAWRYLSGTQGPAGGIEAGRERDEEKGFHTGTPMSGRFYAVSELYRASNEKLYHNYILQNQELLLGQKEDFYLLMGKVTYLSTRRDVDQELCGLIMDSLMKEAEDITARTKAGLFLTDGESSDDVLWNMTVMALANYAIMNHEYVTVIENNMHYLLGRNAEAEFLPGKPECREAAAELLLFSVIEAEREIIEASEAEESGKD